MLLQRIYSSTLDGTVLSVLLGTYTWYTDDYCCTGLYYTVYTAYQTALIQTIRTGYTSLEES